MNTKREKAHENDLRWLTSQIAQTVELQRLAATAPSAEDVEDIEHDIRKIAASVQKRFGKKLTEQILRRLSLYMGPLKLEG